MDLPLLIPSFIVSLSMALYFALLSPWLVAKKLSLTGEILSHTSLLSGTLSYLCWPLLFSALFPVENQTGFRFASILVTTMLGLFFAALVHRKSIPQDAYLGIFLALSLSLAIISNQFIPPGTVNFSSLLFGEILFVGTTEWVISLVMLVILGSWIKLKYKQLVYFTIDPTGCSGQGIPTTQLHFTLFFFVSAGVAWFASLAGGLLTGAFLIIPAFFFMRVRASFNRAFPLHFFFIVLSITCAHLAGVYFNLPMSPCLIIGEFLGMLLTGGLYEKYQKYKGKIPQ